MVWREEVFTNSPSKAETQTASWWLPDERAVGGWVKEMKGVKGTLIMMSTESYIELLNCCIVHLNLT